MNKQVYLQTFGCQMNEHDSQQMRFALENNGFSLTAEIERAGVIILNTCSVREGPENKIYSYLGRLRKLKKANPDLILGVGGCVAQQEKDIIFKRSPWVNIVFGPDNYLQLPEMIKQAALGTKILEVNFHKTAPEPAEFLSNPLHKSEVRVNSAKAFIAITKGCDNFCSFCVVPFTRGREVSRPLVSLLTEAENLVKAGTKEIMLLGQNVNSYRQGSAGFYELLAEMSLIKGLERIRFVSPHPKDWNNALSDLMAARPTICNQLHLPFQSGSSRILKLMRRDHDIESYIAKIDYLKKQVPGIGLTADIIVGFPSETEEDFQQTLGLVQKVGYTQIFAYKYSPRPGTKAAKMHDSVPQEIKDARLAQIIDWQRSFIQSSLKQEIGNKYQVLIDKKESVENGSVFSGRTESGVTVKFEQNDLDLSIGQMVFAEITGYKQTCLNGTVNSSINLNQIKFI